MHIHYLEIVTRQVDAVCATYAAVNGVEFGQPDAGLGNARDERLRTEARGEDTERRRRC